MLMFMTIAASAKAAFSQGIQDCIGLQPTPELRERGYQLNLIYYILYDDIISTITWARQLETQEFPSFHAICDP